MNAKEQKAIEGQMKKLDNKILYWTDWFDSEMKMIAKFREQAAEATKQAKIDYWTNRADQREARIEELRQEKLIPLQTRYQELLDKVAASE